jgi:two-component system response regulator FixJ
MLPCSSALSTMTPQHEPTVFVVDDVREVRDALQWLLNSVGLPVQTYESAEQFLDAYQPERPGCLLLDMRMPGMGGLGLLESLVARDIHLPVLILTGHGSVPTAVRAMKAGAVDFLEKPYNNQELLDRVHHALEGDARLRRQREEQSAISARLDTLTPRQGEVLDRLVKGQPNKVVAAELGISERTVEAHRASIMEKMQARSVSELISMVLHLHRARNFK